MAEIVNLNRLRKAKARAAADAEAAGNRVKFGRTKAEKARDAAQQSIAEKTIDAHKREP